MGATTMCGHYVCHIKKDQQWVIFNDQKVCASEKPPKDLGYLYFYRRVTEFNLAESTVPSFLEMSNRHTCLLILVALCLGSVRCEEFYIEQGKIVMMSCSGAPSKAIEWLYNKQPCLKEDSRTGSILKGLAQMCSTGRARMIGSDLRIAHLVHADAGIYTCESKTVRYEHRLYVISVSASPACPLLPGTEAELRCQISGGSDVKPVWLRPDGKHGETSEMGSHTLQSVDPADNGTWACQIKSELRLSLSITVLGLSSTPKLTMSQGGSVLLPCIASQSLSSIGSLRLQEGGWERLSPGPTRLLSLEKKGGQLFWNSTGVQRNTLLFEENKLDANLSVTLKKVTVQQAGQYQCFLTFQGKGTVSAQVSLEVKGQPGVTGDGPGTNGLQPKNKEGFLGLNLWVWLAVGAGCLVLTLLTIIIVYLNRRNKRMKRRARKLRSMRQPLTNRDYCQCNRNTEAGRPNGRQRDKSSVKERQR
ncbi:hypothetical protein SKAU_G00225040 [Synaphobranchus kaupii]|uniref:T-cell surface glycoprotein CD4 n=1 Tax=Synaphobranchus kaupii TaxID=118154 RepID=A0A9Q1FBP0_SYNKA|nr:hypothetical protein SKAU_G00225040 [Synaphobranchus kaupii]